VGTTFLEAGNEKKVQRMHRSSCCFSFWKRTSRVFLVFNNTMYITSIEMHSIGILIASA
jgi:hypothetical protein